MNKLTTYLIVGVLVMLVMDLVAKHVTPDDADEDARKWYRAGGAIAGAWAALAVAVPAIK